ncbi:uncharacterized protein [Lolium perenne]|uniref:uncharacterized protein n=1 Tax=Lolium perenne TaxID=4522 RepID=UPI0021EA9F44|nr:uncharacterized protein LOC127309151 [Lolium perenne]
MAAAAVSRPSGPVPSIPNYGCASPNRVKLAATVGARSPGKAVSVSSRKQASSAAANSRQSCMCSPTNHPGSFRCSKHKGRKESAPGHSKPAFLSSSGSKLGTKRMDSALVFGCAVESGTWARRALAPSPSQQSQSRRRTAGGFRPRPSRLSSVSFAGDRAGDNRQ